MKQARWSVVLPVVFALAALACSAWAGGLDALLEKGGLDKMLGQQLGLTDDQSAGGIGAILGLAKEKLDSGDFSKLAEAIPGADKYLKSAKKQGVLESPIGSKDGLAAAFAKLGIPEDKTAQIVPKVTELVGQIGGEEVQGLLSSIL